MTSLDASQVKTLSKDLAGAPARLASQVRAVVVKGAVNVKGVMREELAGSRHFSGAERDVNFDIDEDTNAIAAEVGPRIGMGKGHKGSLAWIAFNGSSKRGPSVRTPDDILDEESPRFESALAGVIGDLL